MGQYRFATAVWPLAAFAASAAGVHVVALLRPRGRAVLAAIAAVAALSSGVQLAGSAREFRAAPTVPLCAVAAGTGAAPNLYADRLGLVGGTLVAPDMGGAAMTSQLHLVDLVGLTDAQMAGFFARGDMAGLRDYVLGELRPEMLETHGFWSKTTGLVDDPRLAAGWVKIEDVDAQSGLWVRADLISPQQLPQLRAESVTEPEVAVG